MDEALQPQLPEELFQVPVALVDALLNKLPQADLPVRNWVFPLFAVREMTLPAGALVVARRYKCDHMCICTKGQVTVWGDGVAPEIIEAGEAFRAPAGTQRVGYFHEETTWLTILPNPFNDEDAEEILALAAEAPALPEEYVGLSGEELLALAPAGARAVLSGGSPT